MDQETVRSLPVVSSKELRALGTKVIPVSQLGRWFDSKRREVFEEVVKNGYALGLGPNAPNEEYNVYDDIVQIMLWVNEYVVSNNIDTKTVAVSLSQKAIGSLKRTMVHHRPSSTDPYWGYLLGYPITNDDDQNYIFIPFHPIIRMEILDD